MFSEQVREKLSENQTLLYMVFLRRIGMIFGSNLSQEKIILIQCERPLFSYKTPNPTKHHTSNLCAAPRTYGDALALASLSETTRWANSLGGVLTQEV